MISILSKAATWSPEQPFGEAFSRVFSSRLCSAQLIWTAVERHTCGPVGSQRPPRPQHLPNYPGPPWATVTAHSLRCQLSSANHLHPLFADPADALLGLLDEYEGWNPYDVKWVDEVCVQLMGGNGQEGRKRRGRKAA